MLDEQQRFWISFGFWGATSARLGESVGTSSHRLGASWDLLGAYWGGLGNVFGRLGTQNRQGAVLEPFWSRPGSVLDASWAVLDTSWGRLVGLFEVSWDVLWAFWGIWGRPGSLLCVTFIAKRGYM